MESGTLGFYGMSKDPKTNEFIMVVQFADRGSLKSILSQDFSKILWKDRIILLRDLMVDLKYLHKLEYCHGDFHSGNILQDNDEDNAISHVSYISDFGLSGPADKQNLGGKIYGVLPYIAPEVLNGQPYTKASVIYSSGILMTELSSGKPPFYNRKHDFNLSLAICNGLCPKFGKGTPEFYKKLAYRCMNADPNQRPVENELYDIFQFGNDSNNGHFKDEKKFGYYGREIKEVFDKADDIIPYISVSYKQDPNAIYISRAFNFTNLPKPVNSSLVTSYLEKDENDKGIIF